MIGALTTAAYWARRDYERLPWWKRVYGFARHWRQNFSWHLQTLNLWQS